MRGAETITAVGLIGDGCQHLFPFNQSCDDSMIPISLARVETCLCLLNAFEEHVVLC